MKIIVILLIMFFFLGCVSEWRVVAEPKTSKETSTVISTEKTTKTEVLGKPTTLDLEVQQKYAAAIVDDWYDVNLYLYDSKEQYLAVDGTATLTIVDEMGNELYKNKIEINKEDFEEQEIGYYFSYEKAHSYKIKVPFKEINKSKTSNADFKLEFLTNEGKTLKSTENIYLSYSLVESDYGSYDNYGYGNYSYGNYDSYNKNLTKINLSVAKEGIEVKLIEGGSYGYYNDYDLKTEIKNLGTVKKEISIREAVLILDGKQYIAELYNEDKDLGKVFPQAALPNNFLFYAVQKNAKNATFYLEVMSIENNNPKIISFDINFSP